MSAEIRYEEARERLAAAFGEVAQTERIAADEALGRIAADDVVSPLNLPQTANAAVDGYAVRADDLAQRPNQSFRIIGTAKAGHPFTGKIKDGEAVRVFTGAILPDGVDCAMMQEFCDIDDECVRFQGPMEAGKNCRPAGENLAIGEVIIHKGERLTPPHVAQLAAAGLSDVRVKRPLRVGILSTGDELYEAQAPDGSQKNEKQIGQIYDSNRPLLAQFIKAAGHQLVDGGIIADDKAALARAYQELAQHCDIVISSGGASEGVEDHAKSAMQDIGAEILFWRVALKPGRPMGAAKLGHVPLFSLPGNPVAVYVCAHLFVAPVFGALLSGQFTPLRKLILPIGFAVKKRPHLRAEFLRVKLALTNDGETVMLPHGRKGAGVLSSLTGADGLVELPFEAGDMPEGQKLPFIPM